MDSPMFVADHVMVAHCLGHQPLNLIQLNFLHSALSYFHSHLRLL